MSAPSFSVLCDDNFHYRDETERYKVGDFDTLAAAISACQRVVNGYLDEALEVDMSAAALYESYIGFGPDPFIVGADDAVPFSAWDYARQRCQELCRVPSEGAHRETP
jgi:hypothetical protein